MSITLDGTLGITTPTYGGAVTAEYSVPVTAFKNRIINGAMVINQRGFGTTPSNYDYLTDRFQYRATQSGKFTVTQSNSAPTGFINSLAFVSASAATIGSTDQFGVRQFIEGLNITDLAWGSASASTITLSFWVYSSLTGTHSGALGNSGDARAYPFTFTINSASTWEYKTVTIAGDQSGTWLTSNGIGIKVNFNLGAGSSMLGTAGAWTNGEIVGVTGSVQVAANNGATFRVAGVQLEKGTTATSFDYRPYGTELALCQRYLPAWFGAGTQALGISQAYATTNSVGTLSYPVTPRTTPTGISTTGSFYVLNATAAGIAVTSVTLNSASLACFQPNFTVASGLVAGNASVILANGTCAIYATGCEL